MSMIKAIVESVNEHNDWQEEKIAKLEELIREYRSRILLHTNEETLFAIDQDVADWKFRTEPSGLCNTGGRIMGNKCCSNCGDNVEAARYHKALERIKALPIDDPRDEAPLIANAIATKALNQGDTK